MKKLLFSLIAIQALLFILFAFPPTKPVVAQTQAQIEYVSPEPHAKLVPPKTTITLRLSETVDPTMLDAGWFSVRGSQSQAHPGTVVLADDAKTLIFKPTQPFALGEIVSVQINPIKTAAGHLTSSLSFSFAISGKPAPVIPNTAFLLPGEGAPSNSNSQPRTSLSSTPKYLTIPSDFPTITVTAPANGTADGYVFLAPFPLGLGSSYLTILDNAGQPVYWQQMAGPATDFKKQINNTLTYGMNGQFYALDNTYKLVDTYQTGNGYTADGHDLQLLPNGHALLMAYDTEIVDLSQVVPGGDPNAAVTGLIVQELDTSKNVVFQWRSWDHFLITDTLISLTTPVNGAYDYVHGNAIELDTDGNWLLSSRHLSEITKISRQDGHIIWRMGGKNNQFTFVNDTATSVNGTAYYFNFQHDIRRLPNGNITLFDNNDLSADHSRAVEYQLDEINKVATRVWQYRNTPDTYAFAMGNTQRLGNGNTMIGWGTAGMATEVKPDNSKAFEIALSSPYMDYRAFRMTWHGYPTTLPTLVEQCPTFTTTVLTSSWNGATDIASYKIYSGTDPNNLTFLETTPRTGFETQTTITNTSNKGLYFKMMPVDTQSHDTTYSSLVMCHQAFLPLISK